MALILALIDGGTALAVAGGALLVGARPWLAGGGDALMALPGALVVSLSLLLAFYCTGLYDLRAIPSFDALLGRVPGALAAAVPCVAAASTLAGGGRLTGDGLASSILVAVWVVFGPLLPVRAAAYRLLGRCGAGERVLILGQGPLAPRIIDEIEGRRELRAAVVGVVDDPAGLDRAARATRPHRIVVALAERRGRLPLCRLLESRARGILVEDAVETYERLTGKLALEALTPSSVIFSRDFRASRPQLVLARALSVIASAIGLVGLAPVLALLALLIRLDSPGPVFFVQERVGRAGRPFRLIKFRTMHPVDRPASEWEGDNTDRITRLGRWLRRFRLDELPQLVNVLRGDMNLVGPRPHPATNLELMILAARNLSDVSGDAIPYYSLRCSVRPGITGWAQIRYGYANSLEEEVEKLCYDLYYIKHQSLWLDLRILFETLVLLVRGRGLPVRAPGPGGPHGRAPARWEPRARGSTAGPPAGLVQAARTEW